MKAKEQLLFKTLHGREIRITNFDKEQLKRQQVNLFVKNLGLAATNASLYSMFKTFGEIFSSKLAQNSEGKSKGYGFVQYLVPEHAQKAQSEMNGKAHESMKLIVEPYKQKPKDQSNARVFTNLYVKNLPGSITTAEALDKLFGKFGERGSVTINQSELKGKTGYFGFVAFKNSADAAKALEELNGKVIEGVALYVGKALCKEERERDKRKQAIEAREKLRKITLYVKSINGDPLSEELIKEQLHHYGNIKQINILKRKDNQGKESNLPIAFAVFEKEEQIRKALIEYKKPDRLLIISQLENKTERRKRIIRARRIRTRPYYGFSRQYMPMFQNMSSRIQRRYNYLLNMRGRPKINDNERRERMLIRPFYMMRPLIHPYPQRLAVPMIRKIA